MGARCRRWRSIHTPLLFWPLVLSVDRGQTCLSLGKLAIRSAGCGSWVVPRWTLTGWRCHVCHRRYSMVSG